MYINILAPVGYIKIKLKSSTVIIPGAEKAGNNTYAFKPLNHE